jgi:hypothetical protein
MSKLSIAAACLVAATALPLAAHAAAEPAAGSKEAKAASAAKGPLTASDTVTMRATVEKIDLPTRTVTLKGEKGNVADVVVGPEYKNLDKLRVGDTVVATYTESLALRIATKAEANVGAAVSASVTPPGNGKSVGAQREITQKLRIEAIDLPNNRVTVSGPAGGKQTIDVKNPKVQERLKALKAGDEVFITYTESLALKLEPTGAR